MVQNKSITTNPVLLSEEIRMLKCSTVVLYVSWPVGLFVKVLSWKSFEVWMKRSQTMRLYTSLCNRQMWSIAPLCWFPTFFISWWPNLWQKEENFAEEWNHKVGVNTDDVGSYGIAIFSIQCNHIQIRNPCTQAKHCWIYKSAHMFGVFKSIQMNFSCENCKNYYGQYSDSIYPIKIDW